MNPLKELFRLHADVDARVHAIREARPDWPCAKGCDRCCRQLAEIPQLTALEWARLQQGLSALPPERLQEIGDGLRALAKQSARPVVCPLLDQASGACPVYAQRPVACRSYGFYVQRGVGLYCCDIETRVARGEMAEVIWGNHDAVEQGLTALGESRSLDEWFAHWQGSE